MFERNYNLLNLKFKEFFLPTLLLAASLNVSAICDTLIIGNILGSNALAATVLCAPIMTIITAIEMTLGFGGSTIATIAKADRKIERSKEIFTISIISLLIIGVLIAVFGTIFLKPLSNLLVVGNQSLFSLVSSYLQFLLLGAPLMLLPLGFSYFIRAEGKPNTATFVFIIANIVNVLFDFILIGFFKMGIAGGSLSTVIGYAVGMLLVVKYLISPGRVTKFTSKLKNKFEIVKEIVISGLSPASGQIFMFLKIFLINSLVLLVLGNSGAVAMSLCYDMLLIVSIVIAGVCESFSPMIAVLFKEKDNNGVKFIMKKSFKLAIGFSVIFTVFLLIFPNIITHIYGITSPNDILVSVNALRIFALSFAGVSFSFLMLFYYQTIAENKLSLLISVCEGLLFIVPLAYLLSYLLGGFGLWLSFIVTEVLTAILIFISIKRISKKSNYKNKGLLLLDQEKNIISFDLTLKGSCDEVINISKDLIKFSKENGLDDKTSMYLGLAVEEMAINTINYNALNSFNLDLIDILIKITKEEIIFSFKDSGIEFDPTLTEVMESNEDNVNNEENINQFTNIDVLKKISNNISYVRILGLNSTLINISR
ncbi:MAG: hypothetical protein LBM26_05450 [Methanobrevibacter sp.]|jgi:Na+-driven multidrug efflux pump/anti-sigma regulatory factor (Ser/Thr protein kinase)|nr:hypothetical protein [Methanobrevibacter sp.]